MCRSPDFNVGVEYAIPTHILEYPKIFEDI